MSCVVVSPSNETVSIIECAFDQRGLKTTQLFCDVSSENFPIFSNTSDSSGALLVGTKDIWKLLLGLHLDMSRDTTRAVVGVFRPGLTQTGLYNHQSLLVA